MLRTTQSAMLAFALLIPVVAIAQGLDRYPTGNPVPVPLGHAESGTLPVPHHMLGTITVGQQAPDFELERATGGKQRLSAMRGGWVALWFGTRTIGIASADTLARALENDAITVVVIAAERTGALRSWLEKHPTRVMLLSDASCDIASEYGAFDLATGQAKRGLVVLDESGVVRVAVVGYDLPAADAARMVQIARASL